MHCMCHPAPGCFLRGGKIVQKDYCVCLRSTKVPLRLVPQLHSHRVVVDLSYKELDARGGVDLVHCRDQSIDVGAGVLVPRGAVAAVAVLEGHDVKHVGDQQLS